MSLRDEVADVVRGIHKGPTCTVGKMLRAMPDDLAAEVEDVMADDGVPMTAVARVLKARGIPNVPASQTFARHKRGECSCG